MKKIKRSSDFQLKTKAKPLPTVLVVWKDFTGLPRAWATGPLNRLPDVRKAARQQLEQYCRRDHDLPELHDPEKYTENVSEVPPENPVVEELRRKYAKRPLRPAWASVVSSKS